MKKTPANIWDEEHKKAEILPQMDRVNPSSGIVKLVKWLDENNVVADSALEMCCGKGRNVIWLSQQGIHANGIDYSEHAIRTAQNRATKAGVVCDFNVHDVTQIFPYPDNSFDLVIDCFGSTDIEGASNRRAARDQMIRVLKPSGYYMAYLIDADDEFHAMMSEKYPASEPNSFNWPENNKFEKCFTKEEIAEIYSSLTPIHTETIDSQQVFSGNSYKTKNIWSLFQKS